MTFYFRIILVLFTLVLLPFSCAETSEDTTAVVNDEQQAKALYGSTMAPLPKVSEVARIETEKWSVFDDFEENVSLLKNQTVAVIKGRSGGLILETDSLQKNIPEALDTRPIYARLILANTRAKLLNQLASYDKIDSLQLENGLKEMNLAAATLFTEINRTFKKNKIDEELKESEKKELEQQQRFLDSVYKSEIQDNKQ